MKAGLAECCADVYISTDGTIPVSRGLQEVRQARPTFMSSRGSESVAAVLGCAVAGVPRSLREAL